MNYQYRDYFDGNSVRRLAPLAAAVLALLLAACAPLPPKDAAPAFATPRATDLVADAPASAAASPGEPALGDYGDAQLGRLIALALQDSPTMAVAQARVRQADAAAGQTQAAAGASLALDGSATRERYPEHSLYPPPIAGSWRTSGHVALDFAYDFDFWGRNRNALDAALGRATAARADARAAAATLAAGVARTYFQWQAADQHLKIAQQVGAQRQALVERQARRVRAGLAPGADLAPLDADAAAPRQSIVQLQTQRAQAERQLQALVGVHALPALQPAPLPAPAAIETADLRLDLLAHRPEVAAARDRVQAALRDVDAQRAAFYPDVTLSALAGFDALQLSSLLHGANREFAATPAIHLPIFDAGRLRAGLASKRADVALAVAQYDQALQQAVADVNDATVRLQGAQREAAPLAGQRLARERDLASAKAREQAGLIDGQQRLVDELVLTALQDQEITLRLQTLVARIDLDRALGGALPAPARVAAATN
ncbi:MAG TPA: efflux transporter outer membrane subunit [Burkholderiaceae bacterium]